MYIIYIDTTDRYKKSVRLLKNGQVVDVATGDIDVVFTIEALLKKHGLVVQDIDRIEFNRGPGSFTGLKIAAAIANTFNWALGRRRIGELVYPEYGSEPNISVSKK